MGTGGKLTALGVKRLVARGGRGRHLDGDNLQLRVTGPGRAKWIYRYALDGKTHELGLGAERHVSLAEAREAAAKIRKAIRDGRDPKARVTGATFREVAEDYIK